jgi:hypothetical protein
MESW